MIDALVVCGIALVGLMAVDWISYKRGYWRGLEQGYENGFKDALDQAIKMVRDR